MQYKIVPAHLEAHLFDVSLTIPNPAADGQVLSLPAWIPGSYMIRDFAKNIVSINAYDELGDVVLVKLDKSTWRAAPAQGALTVRYQVYAWDLSVRAAYLDRNRAYFNGTSVFLSAHGQEDQPCTVEIESPAHDCAQHWRVATTLTRDGAELYGFGRYHAANYAELVDHPVEIADYSLATFMVNDIPHDVVISGRHQTDMTRICNDLTKICQHHVDMFGELPPMERYMFLVNVVGDGYGGLEHRASTSLLCSREDLPLKGVDKQSDRYRTFLGLCSHEYFHTWNVKRIKPEVFEPYDLSQEVYTRQLWAFEGITSYYDDLTLVRCGVIEIEEYLQMLAESLTRVWRAPGRFRQSVAESSFDAWTKFYRQDENAANAIISYYTKGAVIAMALDFRIRCAHQGEKSLDDLMRRLWRDYGKQGIGVPEGRIEALAAELCGEDLTEFFTDYLYGNRDPDLGQSLQWLGIDFSLRAPTSLQDKGGAANKKPTSSMAAALGISVVAQGEQARLAVVLNDRPAERAGLAAGDVLIAINGLKVTLANFEALMARYACGDEVEIHAFRRDELNVHRVRLETPQADIVNLECLSDVDESTLVRRNDWLGVNPWR